MKIKGDSVCVCVRGHFLSGKVLDKYQGLLFLPAAVPEELVQVTW